MGKDCTENFDADGFWEKIDHAEVSASAVVPGYDTGALLNALINASFDCGAWDGTDSDEYAKLNDKVKQLKREVRKLLR